MTVLVDDMLDDVSRTLLDTARRTWSRASLVGYMNEALFASSAVKPDVYTVRANVPLEEGTLQELPTGGIALIDIPRNSLQSGGDGRVVTQVDAEMLAEANRFWPAATTQSQVEHYTADPRDPRRFQVFPPNDGTGLVEMLYAAVPSVTGSSGEAFPLADIYQPAVTAYMEAKAHAKNTRRQDLAKVGAALQRWGTLMGLNAKALAAIAPKVLVSEGKQ